MIDCIKMSLKGKFPPKGATVSIIRSPTVTSVSTTKDRYCMFGHGSQFTLQVREEGREIYLEFCPPKVLQGHNGIGSNDLLAVAEQSVRAIFDEMAIPLTKRVERRLKEGDYVLHEVHIAELHAMSHALILALCDTIRRYGPASLEAVPLRRGIGVRLWMHSRYRIVLIYDKVQYFLDKPAKHKQILLAGARRLMQFDLIRKFAKMLTYLLNGVRIETRLLAPYLKQHKLDRGDAWSVDVARREHLNTLSSIPLRDLPSVPLAESVLAQVSGNEKALIALWLAGRNPRAFATSRSAFYRCCDRILNQFGLDLKQPALKLPEGVVWKTLVSEESIIDPPAWAFRSGFGFRADDLFFRRRGKK
ncbi:MAG: hypothetical protein JWQ21_817 [Herminiimonas sp.]|nr:hypothetical protein [Herminiimonas sp.]